MNNILWKLIVTCDVSLSFLFFPYPSWGIDNSIGVKWNALIGFLEENQETLSVFLATVIVFTCLVERHRAETIIVNSSKCGYFAQIVAGHFK